MTLQRTRFRFGKSLHGEAFQRVIGDVMHEFHGSLFRCGIGWQGLVMVPIIAKEGIDGFRDKACCDDCGCG